MLREKNAPVIQDGIASLHKALHLRPDYDDAMAYLNLLYREKATWNAMFRRRARGLENRR